MARSFKEIADIWEQARSTLTTERTILVKQRDDYKKAHDAASVKPKGFKGHLKYAFDKVNPFNPHNKEMKRLNALVDKNTNNLNRRAQSAYRALCETALEQTSDKKEDSSYAAMAKMIDKINDVKAELRQAASKCSNAENWERSDMASKASMFSIGSNLETLSAISAVSSANKSLTALQTVLKRDLSDLSGVAGDLFGGTTFELIMDSAVYNTTVDTASMLNIEKLRNAQSALDDASKKLTDCAERIQGRIDNRGPTTLRKLSASDPVVRKTLDSLSPYIVQSASGSAYSPRP